MYTSYNITQYTIIHTYNHTHTFDLRGREVDAIVRYVKLETRKLG